MKSLKEIEKELQELDDYDVSTANAYGELLEEQLRLELERLKKEFDNNHRNDCFRSEFVLGKISLLEELLGDDGK